MSWENITRSRQDVGPSTETIQAEPQQDDAENPMSEIVGVVPGLGKLMLGTQREHSDGRVSHKVSESSAQRIFESLRTVLSSFLSNINFSTLRKTGLRKLPIQELFSYPPMHAHLPV